jgi:hypothetical protein
MIKKLICLLAMIAAFEIAIVAAQEGSTKPAEGTVTLDKKSYHLAHALAYESTIDDEPAVVMVLSGQPVSSEALKEARAAEADGGDGDFDKPFLKLVFKKTGELKYWSAGGGGTTMGRHSAGDVKAELKLLDGRATGKAIQTVQADAMIPSAFDVRFNAVLLKAGEELPASTPKKRGPAANIKPTVTGTYKGNGKDARIAYVSAHWVEPFSGKPGIELIFTEKDHSKDNKAGISAVFGKYGSALIISLHEDGEIYGCQVAHNALEKKGFSSIGSIETSAFTYDEGKVEGELTTNGPVDTFGEKWEVKLNFVAPLGEIPKEFQVAEPAKTETKEASVKSGKTETEDADELDIELGSNKSGPTAGGLKVTELALTKDASDIQYNPIVEQLQFKSKSPVKSVCAELATNLKAQGWTSEGPDMVNPNSSILRRKRGDATLTIFVKPETGGSEVKMMTEGLTWDEN